MIRVTAALVEIEADDPAQLAGFYERLFGLVRRPLMGDAVLLEGHGVALRIKRSPGLDDLSERAPFGFVVGDAAELDGARAAAVEAGAVVMAESKREGTTTLACQDPAGNEFVLIALPAIAAAPGEAVVHVPPAVRSGTPTRRDWDRLRDERRLASMREAIAGLGMGFTADDPSTVLDEMRAKIGAPIDSRVDDADAELRARERETAVEDALAKYRQSVVAEESPSPGRAGRDEEPEVDDAEPAPRTLGRTVRNDDE